jgi:hypothetical protein
MLLRGILDAGDEFAEFPVEFVDLVGAFPILALQMKMIKVSHVDEGSGDQELLIFAVLEQVMQGHCALGLYRHIKEKIQKKHETFLNLSYILQ